MNAENWKQILKDCAGGIILLILGFLCCHFFDKTAQKNQIAALNKAVQNNYAVPKQSAFTDATGIRHSQFLGHQNTFNRSVFRQLADSNKGGPDTAAQVLKIQKDQIDHWMGIAMQTQGDNLRAKTMIDSLKRRVLYYKDKFIQIAYHPGIDSNSNGTFDYQANDDLKITQYWKRKWFLGDKSYYIDISSNNPYTTIEGLRSLTIQPDKSNFSLRGQLRTSYDFASKTMIPSAGVIVDEGHFGFAGRYYYSKTFKKLEPIISATWNFINIK